MISGTKGYVTAEAPWWKTTDMEVHYENPLEVEKYSEPFLGDGLRYEISAFVDRVNGVESKVHGGGKRAVPGRLVIPADWGCGRRIPLPWQISWKNLWKQRD